MFTYSMSTWKSRFGLLQQKDRHVRSDIELYVRPEEDLGASERIRFLHEMPKVTTSGHSSVLLNRDWINMSLDLCLEVIWL